MGAPAHQRRWAVADSPRTSARRRPRPNCTPWNVTRRYARWSWIIINVNNVIIWRHPLFYHSWRGLLSLLNGTLNSTGWTWPHCTTILVMAHLPFFWKNGHFFPLRHIRCWISVLKVFPLKQHSIKGGGGGARSGKGAVFVSNKGRYWKRSTFSRCTTFDQDCRSLAWTSLTPSPTLPLALSLTRLSPWAGKSVEVEITFHFYAATDWGQSFKIVVGWNSPIQRRKTDWVEATSPRILDTAPNTVANATKIVAIATKTSVAVAKLLL